MDLFIRSDDAGRGPAAGAPAPLAHRMRPRDLEEWVGHDRLVSPGRPLRQWIDADRLPSLILWGPPGCGKTSFGKLLAGKTRSRFVVLSAVTAGVKDLKEKGEEARAQLGMHGRRTIVFIDEIHRFSKSQQDALLPYVEEGVLTLVGATTENPSFELNSALLSRVRVVRLERLDESALVALLERALVDPERGLGGMLRVERAGLEFIARCSEGDARRALTALESLALMAGVQELSCDEVVRFLGDSSALGRQPLPYDKAGEEHYNVVSAFIKSIRQNDPHAGLYYLARMVEGGEDPVFIARRLVILASEDVGNADPRALQVAIAAKDAVEFIGMPEGRIPLAQAVTYLALAPKSRASYEGIGAALEEVHASGAQPVPMHLRNAATRLMKEEGYGVGYGRIRSHLPEAIRGRRFYEPTENGLEKQMKEKLDRLNPTFDE